MTNEIDLLKDRIKMHQKAITIAQIVIEELEFIVKRLEQGTSK